MWEVAVVVQFSALPLYLPGGIVGLHSSLSRVEINLGDAFLHILAKLWIYLVLGLICATESLNILRIGI